jgi:AcrR family transcriptional regulator
VIRTDAKAKARRADIIDRLADHVLAHGLDASSLRPLAAAAQTSDRMLLYYFTDKADLIAATLAQIAARLHKLLIARSTNTRLPLAALRAQLVPLILDDALWPYMKIWLEIASRSARHEQPYRTIGEQIARGFLAWGASQLDSPSAAQLKIDAAQLLMGIEGMVLLKSLGLDDVCRDAR